MLLWYSLKDSTTCKSLLYVVFLHKIWSCLALLYNLMVFCDNTVQYLLNDTVKCYLDIKLYKGDSQHISCLIIVDIDSNISLLYTVRDNTEHYHCTLLSPDGFWMFLKNSYIYIWVYFLIISWKNKKYNNMYTRHIISGKQLCKFKKKNKKTKIDINRHMIVMMRLLWTCRVLSSGFI